MRIMKPLLLATALIATPATIAYNSQALARTSLEANIDTLADRAKWGALRILKDNPGYSIERACENAASNDQDFAKRHTEGLRNAFGYRSYSYTEEIFQNTSRECQRRVIELLKRMKNYK